jgi:hypothetical protein
VSPARPALSVVVVAYEMRRELPRTIESLSPPYQRVGVGAVEIVVVDNGSATPVDPAPLQVFAPNVRVHRVDPAPSSPAQAANIGIELATGDLIGLIIDGARMASPGLLTTACAAASVAPRPIVTAPAWHLGPDLHMRANASGYDAVVEDGLLRDVEWESDGYALFTISTPAASSARGLFGPMGESSSLFMPRQLWHELDGLDERFTLPGGGLVNHDLYRRACALDDAQLVVMLGEGTFHQIHGGAATSRHVDGLTMRADYEAIRGEPYAPPGNKPIYAGHVPPQYLDYVSASAQRASEKHRSATEYHGALTTAPAYEPEERRR